MYKRMLLHFYVLIMSSSTENINVAVKQDSVKVTDTSIPETSATESIIEKSHFAETHSKKSPVYEDPSKIKAHIEEIRTSKLTEDDVSNYGCT